MAESNFLSLVVIAAVAFLAPLLSFRTRHFRIPAIVIEIFLGIVLGRSGLRVIEPGAVVEFLAAFGFILLMFLSGFELNFSLLQAGRRRWHLIVPPLVFALSVAGAFAGSWQLQQLGLIDNLPLFALILCTISVGIVLPVLKERHEVGTPLGQDLILTALIADLSTIILLTVYVSYRSKGLSVEMWLVAVVFLAFLAVYLVGRRLMRASWPGRLFGELAHASTQIKVRGTIVLLICFVALAQTVGVEAILAAFLVGLLVSLFSGENREILGLKLDAFGYGFFVPIFFVTVGARLELAPLLHDPSARLLVPLLMGLTFVVKVVPSMLWGFRFGFRNSLAGGFLLSSQLGLKIAAAEIALKIGAISGTVYAAIVITALLSCIVSPVLYSAFRKVPRWRKPKIVIVGAGRIGREIVGRLLSHDLDVVLVERDRRQVGKLKTIPRRVVMGEATSRETLAAIDMQPQDVFVSLTGDDDKNLEACLLARREFGVTHVIARDNNPANTVRFQQAGVTPLDFSSSVAVALENLILRPSMAHLLADFGRDVFAFEIVAGRPGVAGQKIRDLKGRGDALIVLIRRGDEVIVPHGDVEIHEGDRLVCLGTMEEEQRLRENLCATGDVLP
jgi:Kef-type K+ transport system membrane component KefB/Trk K+ transport system NAD-binding subunit